MRLSVRNSTDSTFHWSGNAHAVNGCLIAAAMGSWSMFSTGPEGDSAGPGIPRPEYAQFDPGLLSDVLNVSRPHVRCLIHSLIERKVLASRWVSTKPKPLHSARSKIDPAKNFLPRNSKSAVPARGLGRLGIRNVSPVCQCRDKTPAVLPVLTTATTGPRRDRREAGLSFPVDLNRKLHHH